LFNPERLAPHRHITRSRQNHPFAALLALLCLSLRLNLFSLFPRPFFDIGFSQKDSWKKDAAFGEPIYNQTVHGKKNSKSRQADAASDATKRISSQNPTGCAMGAAVGVRHAVCPGGAPKREP